MSPVRFHSRAAGQAGPGSVPSPEATFIFLSAPHAAARKFANCGQEFCYGALDDLRVGISERLRHFPETQGGIGRGEEQEA